MIRLLVILYVTWCTGLYLRQDSILFPTGFAPPPLDELPRDGIEVLILDLDDGAKVYGWFAPAPGAGPENPAPLVVFFHGNAAIIDYKVKVIDGYHALGCSVFLPEYRGYGRAGGKPSQTAIVADCVRFYDKLAGRPDVDAKGIVYHGRSLGGAVAAALTRERKPVAMILGSTFTSVGAMARRYLVPTFLVRHPFRTDKVVAELDIPLLIGHGTEDSIIPVRHGRRLRDLAPRAVYVEYPCGHNDFPGVGNEEQHWARVREFLAQARVIAAAGT